MKKLFNSTIIMTLLLLPILGSQSAHAFDDWRETASEALESIWETPQAAPAIGGFVAGFICFPITAYVGYKALGPISAVYDATRNMVYNVLHNPLCTAVLASGATATACGALYLATRDV